MSLGLRVRLSAMMFLQYAVWGLWLPMLNQFLTKSGFTLSVDDIGWIFSVYGFGAVLGPFVVGQIADRYLSTEKVLTIAHGFGGLILIATAYMTSFWPIFLALFAYCNLYMPTMGLSNSITFRSLGEANQGYFPGIRLWGTIGWIVAGLGFAAYLDYNELSFYGTLFELVGLKSTFASFLGWWRGAVVPLMLPLFQIPWVGPPQFRDCLRLSGVVSIFYGLYCLTLPHTPPVPAESTGEAKPSAVLESLALLKHRSFAVLVVVTGLIGIMLAFYFACENAFLEAIKIKPENTGAYMTIGQVAEIACMALVPAAVARFGVKSTMIIGASAWALRFGLSAYGQPQWLMIATIALHGFAFGFFFVVAQMYVDRAASPDIKATAQSLLIFVVYGLGTVLGSALTGRVRALNTFVVDGVAHENWRGIWMGPFLLTVACILGFALLFRDEEIRTPTTSPEPSAA